MSSNKKSIVDFIPHPRSFDPLDIIHSILKEKPKKEEAIIAIESCISEFEAYQNLKMQEINNYVKTHHSRYDFSSVGTIGKIYAEKIALLKKALSVIEKKGIHALKEWLFKEFIEKEKRERYLDSIYPSMKNINEEKNNFEEHEGYEGQDELKINKEQFIYMLKKLGEVNVVSKDCARNAPSIYDEHFLDKYMPNSQKLECRINFTTKWMNVRYIFEELFKPWFKESVSWTRFIRKHCLIDGKKANTHNKNTSQYKDRADNHVKRIVDHIYRNVVGGIPPS